MEDRKFRRSLLSTRDVKDISVLGLNENGYSKSVDPLKSRISMSDLYGKEKPLPTTPQECDYYFETREDFNARRDQIIAENSNDLSQKTFGFGDGVTSLFMAFYYTGIISTPKMIFAINVTDFSNCFYNCKILKSISSQLFIKCHNAIDFNYCFCDCHSLTSIPQGLFDNCTKATSFRHCFTECPITTIPQGLFDNCHNVTDFFSCFNSCSSLTTIPQGLFDKCPNVTDFGLCFMYCSNITSALPDVWNKQKFPNVTNGTDYAYNCTKAANYNEIPSNFK